MCNIPIKVSAHMSLNSSKGVKQSRDLEGVREDEMLENISSQEVSAVKRIHISRNNELVPTNTFILTFSKLLFPDSIKAGYLKILLFQIHFRVLNATIMDTEKMLVVAK